MEHVRLAELCAAISLFTDLGTGQPNEHAMRTTLVAMRLADMVGLASTARPALYYTSLLRFFGCTADAAATASAVGGDEAHFYAAMAPVAMGSTREQLRTMTRAVAPGASRPARTRRLLAMMTDRKGAERTLLPHCEVGSRLASRMDLPDGVSAALAAAYARWDGRGVPAGLAGDDIPLTVRITIVAREVVLASDLDGAHVVKVLASRRGRSLDPTVVDVALADVGNLMKLAGPRPDDIWNETVDAEPAPQRLLDGDALDNAFTALADFADLKVDETASHSRQVAAIAADAARLCGVGDEQVEQVRRAGLLHDLGRVGVSNTIWSHPGALSLGQTEKMRLHPYYGERILSRTAGLSTIARLAGGDHERGDGSGYHRGTRDELGVSERALAAADAFQAMSQPRPHRPPLPFDDIVAALREEIDAGRFARKEVDAVLAAAAGERPPVEIPRPMGLTEREVDVLRLIARGRTKKEAAYDLGISPKTVNSHVEHIYAKVHVSTRAAATLFAVEHHLLD